MANTIIISQIQTRLSWREFSTALQKLGTYRLVLRDTQYVHQYDQLMQEILAQIRAEIEEALNRYEFERANRLHEELKEHYPDATIPNFETRVREARGLFDSLKNFYFTTADELFRESRYFAREKYEDLKKDHIEQYVNEKLPSFPI